MLHKREYNHLPLDATMKQTATTLLQSFIEQSCFPGLFLCTIGLVRSPKKQYIYLSTDLSVDGSSAGRTSIRM